MAHHQYRESSCLRGCAISFSHFFFFVFLVVFVEQGHCQGTQTCSNSINSTTDGTTTDATTCIVADSTRSNNSSNRSLEEEKEQQQQQQQQQQNQENTICDDDVCNVVSDMEYSQFYDLIEWNKDRSKATINVEWGEPQTAEGFEMEDTIQNIFETYKFMMNVVYVDPKYEKVRKECKNRYEMCSFWATIGECANNPKFMTLHCAPACKSCDQIDFHARCPFDYSTPGAWNGETNDLNRTFERIVSDPKFERYPITIMSRDPWVVIVDDFVSEDECQRLIDLGAAQGYERSEDVGELKFDGTTDSIRNDGRTSTNAWCVDDCFNDPMSKAVTARIEDLVHVPQTNYEYLQLLRYKKGQFYNKHHDYIEHDLEHPQGVRIMTAYIYLNDVQAGGGTRFPNLNLTVTPKQGRIVLWPSVLNDNPDMEDRRTEHAALPVETGIKYGANAWIHQRDFRTPFKKGCVGS